MLVAFNHLQSPSTEIPYEPRTDRGRDTLSSFRQPRASVSSNYTRSTHADTRVALAQPAKAQPKKKTAKAFTPRLRVTDAGYE